jgi:hypothetical protein
MTIALDLEISLSVIAKCVHQNRLNLSSSVHQNPRGLKRKTAKSVPSAALPPPYDKDTFIPKWLQC